MKHIFKVNIFDQYACGEVNSIAFECNSHSGLHITSEHCILSNENSNIETNLLITNFDNYIFPLINYQNNDLIKHTSQNVNNNAHKISKILGRIGDIIQLPNGLQLHPEFFTHLLSETNMYDNYSIEKFQVVQDELAVLNWYIVSNPIFSSNAIVRLSNLWHNYAADVKLKIIFVSNIENEISGKYRYVISNI